LASSRAPPPRFVQQGALARLVASSSSTATRRSSSAQPREQRRLGLAWCTPARSAAKRARASWLRSSVARASSLVVIEQQLERLDAGDAVLRLPRRTPPPPGRLAGR
jgi:hypothetical protein